MYNCTCHFSTVHEFATTMQEDLKFKISVLLQMPVWTDANRESDKTTQSLISSNLGPISVEIV